MSVLDPIGAPGVKKDPGFLGTATSPVGLTAGVAETGDCGTTASGDLGASAPTAGVAGTPGCCCPLGKKPDKKPPGRGLSGLWKKGGLPNGSMIWGSDTGIADPAT